MNEIIPVEAQIVDAPVLLETCPKCGRHSVEVAHNPKNRHICIDCEKAENNRYMRLRQHQPEWQEIAKASGLELWEQQPNETQWEYSVWLAYRDSYPGKKPSYGDAAAQLNTTYDAVRKIAARWQFNVRLQAWMRHCDELTLTQRHNEILEMNREHVDMAARLRAKLSQAIDQIDVYSLKPSDLNSLFKTAAELERKARVDTIAQEEMRNALSQDNGNPELQKTQTKQEDLGEVVKILMKAGVLGDVTQAGIRQTTTTEIVVRDDSGNESSFVGEK